MRGMGEIISCLILLSENPPLFDGVGSKSWLIRQPSFFGLSGFFESNDALASSFKGSGSVTFEKGAIVETAARQISDVKNNFSFS